VAAVVTIRPARPDDAGLVSGICPESWQAAYFGCMPAGFLARVPGPDSVRRRSTEEPFAGVTGVRYQCPLG
jgi:hypothetical protein